jgi:magnesium transporter
MALAVYARGEDGRIALASDAKAALVEPAAVWIDLLNPTAGEEALVESAHGLEIPSPAEREALEESSRFYEEGGALFLTPTIITTRDERTVRDTITFVLSRNLLVTLRHCTPRAFEIGKGRASVRLGEALNAPDVLLLLLESLVERTADRLAGAVDAVEDLALKVTNGRGRTRDLERHLRALGRLGALAAQARDALGSLSRLARFASAVAGRHKLPPDRLDVLARDIDDLELQADGLTTDVNFLLDAALGLVATRQNDAMKATAGATLLFLPPTLIASIFGMNFEHMTVFREPLGGWLAVAGMAASAVLIGIVAWWRRWL